MPARRRRARRHLVPDRPGDDGERARLRPADGQFARCRLRPRLRARVPLAAAICAMHLSRLAEEIVHLVASAQFGFVKLSDRFTTGSSIMPQKRNPDAAELVRAKPGRILGALIGLLVVMKGLPLAYSKDMQEDKEPAFDAADNLSLALAAMTGHGRDMEPARDALRAAAAASRPPPTSPTGWCAGWACRSARPITSPARWCQFQPGGDAHLARLGAGADVVSEGELRRALAAGVPAGADRVLRRRQDGARDGAGARGHPLLQRRVRAGARTAVGDRGAAGPRARSRCASIPDVDAKTHRKISTGKAENKFGIPGSARARSMPAPPSCRASRRRHRHAYRQPDHRAAALRRRLRAARRVRAHAARRRPRIEHVDLGGGLGIPIATTTSRRRCPTPMPRSSSAHVAARLKVIFEPGRLIVGNAGILVTRSSI
jgi:hypothetical protein